jgi:hypothetical protein
MKFRFIEDHREVFLVRVTCTVLAVSSRGYYAWPARPESARAAANRALLEDTRRVHAASRHRYGSPRVHAALHAQGNRILLARVGESSKIIAPPGLCPDCISAPGSGRRPEPQSGPPHFAPYPIETLSVGGPNSEVRHSNRQGGRLFDGSQRHRGLDP